MAVRKKQKQLIHSLLLDSINDSVLFPGVTLQSKAKAQNVLFYIEREATL